jgi:hypothetical protein
MRWICALFALGGTAHANPRWDNEPDSDPKPLPLDIHGGVSVDYAHAVAHGDQLAFVRGVVRWIGHINYFGAQLDGGLGYAGSGPLGYDVHVRGGMQAHLDGVMRFHFIGFTLGAGIDSYGDLAPRAWTFPIDGYWRVRLYDTLVGVHGGPRFAAGDRAFGWTVGVDVTRLGMWGRGDVVPPFDWGAWKPRDLVISVDATRLAGATYAGISIGFTARLRGVYSI